MTMVTEPVLAKLAGTQSPIVGVEVRESLGSGAVATVHRVEVRGSDGSSEVMAGKILHASHQRDEAAAARFEQEARLLDGVRDDNLVCVHGMVDLEFEGETRRMLLMELVEGPTLAELIARESPMKPERILELSGGIAAGLRAAHAAGLIHRDLKPANVLLAQGRIPKIADFGMARASSVAGVDKSAFTALGTPDYMAPECLDPLALDARSDLYALGAIMFEMATGRPPYDGATPFAVLEAHRRAPVPTLPEHMPEGLRALTAALLAKSPVDRPQAAAAVVDALDRMGRGESRALVAIAKGGRAACAACGQELVAHVGICMNCGLPSVRVEPGPVRVMVVGPGKPGDKLDSVLRERLRQWIRGNPLLGLEPGKLDNQIPRLPFVLTGAISEKSAEAITRSLRELGIDGRVVVGNILAVPEMKKKVTALVGRVALIAATSMAGIVHSGAFIVVALIALLVISGIVIKRSLGRVTNDDQTGARALPAPMRAAFEGLERILPAIQSARHRHALRGVVSRVLTLGEAVEGEGRSHAPEIHGELAQAVEVASVASARLDRLDRELGEIDLNTADPQRRALLHERDTWSARLLDLTASLDGLTARIAAARSRAREDEVGQDLEDLRARVEALEEVQRA
jgi:tRNA A-37 threonylcarbamoyl transferase component Bud32